MSAARYWHDTNPRRVRARNARWFAASRNEAVQFDISERIGSATELRGRAHGPSGRPAQGHAFRVQRVPATSSIRPGGPTMKRDLWPAQGIYCLANVLEADMLYAQRTRDRDEVERIADRGVVAGQKNGNSCGHKGGIGGDAERPVSVSVLRQVVTRGPDVVAGQIDVLPTNR